MSNIKPSDHGIVVQNKESGIRYASTDDNYDPRSERKVRDLRAGETVLGFPVKAAPDGFKPGSESSPEDDEDLNTEDTPNSGDTVDGK